jgi:hypothetical protein
MHLTSSLTLFRRRPRRRREPESPVQERTLRVDADQDAAIYSCSCGFVFKAAVSTSVDCPHCGTAQGW